MKPFCGCLIAIIAPIGLIYLVFFLRGVWIDHTIKLPTTLSERHLYNAEVFPDRFEKDFISAFNFLARDDDYVTPEKQVPYKRYPYSESGDFDLNKDGFTSMLEMEKVRRQSWMTKEFYNSGRSSAVTNLMAFDKNNDQKVTRGEIALELKKIIFQKCPFPQISEDAKLVFLISESGGQPSMVSVSGFADMTKVSNLHIPEDAPKMYIVAASKDPIIYNISGNIDRIENIVVKGSRDTNRKIRSLYLANVGVIGIPKEKVSFLGKSCLLHNRPYGYEPVPHGLERQNKMTDRLKSRLGQPVDITLSEHQLNEVSIPNGYILDTKIGVHKERMSTRKRIRGKWDKSYFDTDLQKIISPTPPVRYEILPGKEGIKQLVREGKIKRLRSEGARNVYQVNEELPHYPVGLVLHYYGFVFDEKTPQPDFNPGYHVRIQ